MPTGKTTTMDAAANPVVDAPGVDADVRPSGADEQRGAEPPAAFLRRVLRPRWRSLIFSAALTIAVAVALLITLPHPRSNAVKVIDPGPTVAESLRYPGFVAYTPSPLPPGWAANSARFSTAWVGPVLHIGYLAPHGGYVGIEQTTGANRRIFVDTMAAGAVFDELVEIDGDVWWHLKSDRKQQDSLVWYGPKSVVIVTGTSSVADLKQLAESLHVGG